MRGSRYATRWTGCPTGFLVASEFRHCAGCSSPNRIGSMKARSAGRRRRSVSYGRRERDTACGNQTIRWHPGEGWLEIRLPAPLAHLANRPHGRYRLSCPVEFSYRGGEVAAQAATGAVRYDISRDPASGRWYLDASWKMSPAPAATLDELRVSPVLAVDLNHGFLAGWAVTPDGNPAGPPVTIPLTLFGLPGLAARRAAARRHLGGHRAGPPARLPGDRDRGPGLR